MRVWDAGSSEELRFDADAFARKELGFIVENGLLQSALWDALKASQVRLIVGSGVSSVDDGDIALVTLTDGSVLRGTKLIAADGAQSTIRDAIGMGVDAKEYGQKGLVAFIHHAQSNQATCWQRFLPTGPLAFLPFNDRCSSIVWTLPDAECDRLLALDDDAFLVELSNAFAGELGALDGASKRVAFPLRRQLASEFARGNVLLIGDAAHVVHPLAGQGVNIGFRDVIALRASFKRGRLSGTAQAKWARQRRSESALAMHAFDGLNRVFSNAALIPALVRGPLLGLANRVPGATLFFWKKAAGL